MGAVLNLEAICADYGLQMADVGKLDVKDKENVITKALGVLAENGFYAMNVFLLSCNQSAYGSEIEKVLIKMLCSPEISLLPPKCTEISTLTKALPDLRSVTEDLPRLILARRMTEQALTFARYHCKAKAKELDKEEKS